MKHTAYTTMAIVAVQLCANAAVAQPATIRLTAVPATVRVRQEGLVQGAELAQIACARNEHESFQIIVTAVGGNVRQVEAEVSPLRNENGMMLPPECVTMYREIYVPIRHSAPHATCEPGFIPDPLVPFTNPYTGAAIREPRWSGGKRVDARFGASGFDLWQERHQPIWVDVHVPKAIPAGAYTGTFTIRAQNAQPAKIPVQVIVWDFVLPDGPTHENHFGGFGYLARYHNVDSNSDAYHLLEDRYIAMMADHRINPPLPRRVLPEVADDGTAVFDERTDRQLAAFVKRYHVTNIEVPRAPFHNAVAADRDKAVRFYQSWYTYLEQKGWADRAYLYMLDEPNDREAYERVRQLGAVVHQAAPQLRRLVVEQPYTQSHGWGTLDGALDIWCPLFGFIDEPSIIRVLAQGDDVWSYSALVQTAPRYHPEYEKVKNDEPPFWQIDFPVTSYRIAPWLNRRYSITGLLYWSTVYWFSPDRNPWDDPGFRIRWNGDGALFYPGEDAGIDGPIASIRLKSLRDGMEDYEYFAILERRGGRNSVEEIVRAAVPTWGTWEQDPYRLLALRRRLADEIVQRQK